MGTACTSGWRSRSWWPLAERSKQKKKDVSKCQRKEYKALCAMVSPKFLTCSLSLDSTVVSPHNSSALSLVGELTE